MHSTTNPDVLEIAPMPCCSPSEPAPCSACVEPCEADEPGSDPATWPAWTDEVGAGIDGPNPPELVELPGFVRPAWTIGPDDIEDAEAPPAGPRPEDALWHSGFTAGHDDGRRGRGYADTPGGLSDRERRTWRAGYSAGRDAAFAEAVEAVDTAMARAAELGRRADAMGRRDVEAWHESETRRGTLVGHEG